MYMILLVQWLFIPAHCRAVAGFFIQILSPCYFVFALPMIIISNYHVESLSVHSSSNDYD